MPWFMGIDIGSVTSKGVIAEDGKQKAYHLLPCTMQRLPVQFIVTGGGNRLLIMRDYDSPLKSPEELGVLAGITTKPV